MLVISNAQMRLLEERMFDRFVDEAVEVLRLDYGPRVEFLGEAEVRRLIRRAAAVGATHGIRNQGALAVLAELMVQFGEHFELSPDREWAEKILVHPEMPDYVRVDMMRQRMTAATKGRSIIPASARRVPPAGAA